MEKEKMMDLIDRQAAIDALEKVAGLFPYRVPGDRDSYGSYPEAWNDAIGRAEMEIEELPSAQPDFYDYSDIEPLWESFAKEHDANLTDGAKQLKDAMWVGYRKGKQDAQPEIIRCKDCIDYQTDWILGTNPDRHYCATMDRFMPEDGFCNYAERRTDEKTNIFG